MVAACNHATFTQGRRTEAAGTDHTIHTIRVGVACLGTWRLHTIGGTGLAFNRIAGGIGLADLAARAIGIDGAWCRFGALAGS